MNIRQIQEARELYGIDDWGGGYFTINDQGNVVCRPTREEHLEIDLMELIAQSKAAGVKPPMILRFPQIIDTQIKRLTQSFYNAIKDIDYKGKHRGVFPFKVNQRREFIDNVISVGSKTGYGLEVGSKTEFIAALSYKLPEDALIVCNGFKDCEFVDLAFIGKSLGKNIILVIEGPEELQMIINHPDRKKYCPFIGIRIKLYSKGAGKWEQSSGESSKFGLTTIDLLRCLNMIEERGLKDKLAMLHFHIGSQITEIKRIKNAIKEASRVYAKIIKMGFKPQFLNIGGGIGVDYDGSKTSFQSSANYSIQEFANDAVYVISEVCNNENVPPPDIISESGRIIAAYHSVVVTNIRKVQGFEHDTQILADTNIEIDEKTSHKFLIELNYILNNINRKNYIEYYHDAIEYYEELFTLFNLGYLQLKDRAIGEELFHRICYRALYFASFEKTPSEEFEDLQKLMVSKYLANFSIFQSIPDVWAIDQLFPIMPLSQHSQKPNQKATIVDITCDSDGCITKFVDRRDVKSVIDLHIPYPNQDYYLGFFLVGAYQESLANEHNLLGAINEVEVLINSNGEWNISKITTGDYINELLTIRNYNEKEILNSFKEQIKKAEKIGLIRKNNSRKIFNRLKNYLNSYPYLIE